jgi:hypothetical protein
MFSGLTGANQCAVSGIDIIGDILAVTTIISIVLLVTLVLTRRRLFDFLSGYFTPKRKVIIAKGLNFCGTLFAVNIVVVIALYVGTGTLLPSGIGYCLTPY